MDDIKSVLARFTNSVADAIAKQVSNGKQRSHYRQLPAIAIHFTGV
ncbi:MAG: hypothetical protein ACK56Y_06370 [Pseudanabaena sp.]